MRLCEYVVEYEPRECYYGKVVVGNQGCYRPAYIECYAHNVRDAVRLARHYMRYYGQVCYADGSWSVLDINGLVRILGVTKTGKRVINDAPFWTDGYNYCTLNDN